MCLLVGNSIADNTCRPWRGWFPSNTSTFWVPLQRRSSIGALRPNSKSRRWSLYRFAHPTRRTFRFPMSILSSHVHELGTIILPDSGCRRHHADGQLFNVCVRLSTGLPAMTPLLERSHIAASTSGWLTRRFRTAPRRLLSPPWPMHPRT